MEGRRIDGSGVCTVVAIRDWERRGWVLYPHGVAGYKRLCQQALRMPAAQFIDLCRRFVDDDPDPVRSTAPPH